MKITNKQQLVDFVNHGNQVKYLFFWGHQSPKSDVSQSCFSQWYDSPFEVAGIKYQTAEHYMMAEKAKLFDDNQAFQRIIASSHPGEAKRIGRSVRNFDEQVWINHRFEIVVHGNLAKFSQYLELKEFLLNTGNRVLVEASPVDSIWGIGLAGDDSAAINPNLWKGLNLLGFALMEVRDQLAGLNES